VKSYNNIYIPVKSYCPNNIYILVKSYHCPNNIYIPVKSYHEELSQMTTSLRMVLCLCTQYCIHVLQVQHGLLYRRTETVDMSCFSHYWR
jgi:hypothetical protein